jgi:hypothetical protein
MNPTTTATTTRPYPNQATKKARPSIEGRAFFYLSGNRSDAGMTSEDLRVTQQYLGQFLGVLGHHLMAGLDLDGLNTLEPRGNL